MHLSFRSLFFLCATSGAMAGGFVPLAQVHAQDRRTVVEPAMPENVCASVLPSGDTAKGAWKEETKLLQAAIDQCPSGGAVRLVKGAHGGRFVSGPLNMKSGVTLWVDRGVTLAAVSDPRAYDKGAGTCGTIAKKGGGCAAFITFEGTKGGGIVGDGVVDGQGGATMASQQPGHSETWWQLARRAQKDGGQQNNPRLIQAEQARELTFYRITLRNSPNFHVVLNAVEGATFWNIKIDTPADARNTDGIDPGASQDITIARSFIRTGDDNIAIKAGKGATHHISIVDDHFYWGHGLSIGSEVNAGVSDILVRNATLDGTTSGLRIKSDVSRGGLVTRVRYEDVCLRNNKNPLDFDTRYDKTAHGTKFPVFDSISLRNVTGGDGSLILRGYDQAHSLKVNFDGVRFSDAAKWHLENTELSIGPSGVSPGPAGLAVKPARGAAPDCAGRWVAFPATGG
ncbi:polygalacturonase [Rhizobium aquaticum]|uniref:Polygalacturonase n=1 Tax=Rhizobium aquaticum TaxID=1549636 RepID=A0ABV2J5E6_9HYPH